jgi:acetyl-CoA carboxylase / biotin carboxylase 1
VPLPPPNHPQEFVNNVIHTGWLDSRIAANVKAERPPWHLCVIGSAVVRAYESITSKAAEYLGFLSKGQLPPRDVGLIHFSDDLVLEGVKYSVSVVRRWVGRRARLCCGFA